MSEREDALSDVIPPSNDISRQVSPTYSYSGRPVCLLYLIQVSERPTSSGDQHESEDEKMEIDSDVEEEDVGFAGSACLLRRIY